MKTHTKTLLAALTASAMLAGSAQAANLIVNGNFETHSNANNTLFTGGTWTSAGLYHINDNNFGTGKYIYGWGGGGSVHQTVSAPWTTSDTIDIALTTVVTSWGSNSATPHNVTVQLRNTSNVVLWSDTVVPSKSPPGAVLFPSWSIPANLLAATAGDDLNLRIVMTGNGTAIDNVSLTIVTAIPEPGSLALLGLGGLLIASRRRRG